MHFQKGRPPETRRLLKKLRFSLRVCLACMSNFKATGPQATEGDNCEPRVPNPTSSRLEIPNCGPAVATPRPKQLSPSCHNPRPPRWSFHQEKEGHRRLLKGSALQKKETHALELCAMNSFGNQRHIHGNLFAPPCHLARGGGTWWDEPKNYVTGNPQPTR